MNINIRKSQGGFTLIELVIVIVILGILAAVAVPRFVDLSSEAAQAAVNGQASALASASAINFASCTVGSTVAGSNAPCVAVEACADIAGAMTAFDSSRFVVTGAIAGGVGGSAECTVEDTDNAVTATFQGIRTEP